MGRFAVNLCQRSQFCYRRFFVLETLGFDRYAAKETDVTDTSNCWNNLTLPTQHSAPQAVLPRLNHTDR